MKGRYKLFVYINYISLLLQPNTIFKVVFYSPVTHNAFLNSENSEYRRFHVLEPFVS